MPTDWMKVMPQVGPNPIGPRITSLQEKLDAIQPLPSAEEIMDKLEALIPENPQQEEAKDEVIQKALVAFKQPMQPPQQGPQVAPEQSKPGEEIYKLLAKIQGDQSGLQGQENAVDDYQSKLKAYLGTRPEGGLNTLNLKPGLALADAWGSPGSHLAAAYTPPQTPAEFDQQALAAQAQAANLQKGLAGSQNAQTKEKLATLLGMYKADKPLAPYASLLGNRTGDLIHTRVINAIQQDKQLKDLAQSQNNLTSAATNYDGAKIKTVAQFHDLQNSVRSNLGIKGTTTGPERDKMMMDSFGNNWRNAKQYIYGKPEDGSKQMHEMADHLMNLIQMQQQANQQKANARLETLVSGRGDFYNRPENEKKRDGLESIKQKYGQQLTPYQRRQSIQAAPEMTTKEKYELYKQKGLIQ